MLREVSSRFAHLYLSRVRNTEADELVFVPHRSPCTPNTPRTATQCCQLKAALLRPHIHPSRSRNMVARTTRNRTGSAPRRFEHEGNTYAPKAVIGIAFRHLNGTILDHGEFSGGEQKGQANFVLRELGFSVEPITNSFITSRGYAIPEDWEKFQQAFWFNMLQKRMWAYKEVSEGDVLYWYDSKSQRIVWKSKITKLDRFEYSTKEEFRGRLIEKFDEDPVNDPYYAEKSESGYCIAFKVDPLEKLDLEKPDGFKFPQGGWLRGSDPNAEQWVSGLGNDLKAASEKLIDEGYFDPTDAKDERDRKLREIVQRRGQPKFRDDLIAAYGGRCAVTGCDVLQALEAAHISPYLGERSNHVSNGLLLRADIHTLFDLGLFAIEPSTLKVKISDSLKVTSVGDLHDQELTVPIGVAFNPSIAALECRWQQFQQNVTESVR